jgi:N-terminal domain of oxidoreductase
MDFERSSRGQIDWGRVSLERGIYSTVLRWTGAGPEPVVSVDPAQRTWMTRDSYKPKVPLGEVMQSFAVGQVLESSHLDFKAGDLERGDFGWQDYAATDGKTFGGIKRS